MALRHPSAQYRGRNYIRDPYVLEALDDLASQSAFIRQNTNSSMNGVVTPPSSPTAIAVVNSGGFAQIAIMHADAPSGTNYMIQYSTTPNFQSPQEVDNGTSLSLERYLTGKGNLYFRVAAKFLTSAMSPWVYYGGLASPKAVNF